jgi:acyl carrier protein
VSLNQLVATALQVDAAAITDDTSTKTLKAWNSMRHIDVVMALEGHYGIRLGAAEIASLQSMRQIRELLARRGVAE